MQGLLIAWPAFSCLYLLPSKRNDPDLFASVLGSVGVHLLLVLILQSLGAIRAVRSYEAGKIEWARRKREKEREKLNKERDLQSAVQDAVRKDKERKNQKLPTNNQPHAVASEANVSVQQPASSASDLCQNQEEGLELVTLAGQDEMVEEGKGKASDDSVEQLLPIKATSSATAFVASDLAANDSEANEQSKRYVGKTAILALKAGRNLDGVKKLMTEREVDWWSLGNWMTILSLLYETLQLASLPMAELAEVGPSLIILFLPVL